MGDVFIGGGLSHYWETPAMVAEEPFENVIARGATLDVVGSYSPTYSDGGTLQFVTSARFGVGSYERELWALRGHVLAGANFWPGEAIYLGAGVGPAVDGYATHSDGVGAHFNFETHVRAGFAFGDNGATFFTPDFGAGINPWTGNMSWTLGVSLESALGRIL